MIVQPKVRGFVCVTAHPEGCARRVQQEIDYVKQRGPIAGAPKKVLVIGASTGYGLSSRIAAAFGGQADTVGVFYERPASNGRPASAGWYNSVAFEKAAQAAGLGAWSINGDAFSDEIKEQTFALIKDKLGQVDLVVYSLAAPRRTDPTNGETYKSVLKPVGRSFSAKTVDTDKDTVLLAHLDPATDEEILGTQKVMGGEDWALWMDALASNGLLAQGAKTVAYSYIGPEVTWPVYKDGTIGLAKQHLERTAKDLDKKYAASHGGRAWVSVNKAVVTQASSAIPVVPLYLSLLYKLMKIKGIHEGCIEQIYRLYTDHIFSESGPTVDELGRIRLDDLELRDDVQAEVRAQWPDLNTGTLTDMTEYSDYKVEFLNLFGFHVPGVDYDADVEIELDLAK